MNKEEFKKELDALVKRYFEEPPQECEHQVHPINTVQYQCLKCGKVLDIPIG